jgi:hypothetical protein
MIKNIFAILLIFALGMASIGMMFNVVDGLVSVKNELNRIEAALSTEPAAGWNLADGNAH